MDRGVATYARNARNANETTEWEDALIKKGILQPKTKVEEEEEVEEECHLQEYNSEEDDEYDDDRILAMIRAKRMNEMKNQYARSKFGSILPILKDEWTKEVNEASQETFVVVYVYDSSVHDCKLMDILLRDIAKQKPQVKFVSIPSQQCMANWPARNCPTLFVYAYGEIQTQLLTLKEVGKTETTVTSLMEWLNNAHVFEPLEKREQVDDEKEDDKEEDDY